MEPTPRVPVSRESYGALLLMLAAPSVLPGIGAVAAPLAGAASLALGLQLALGRRVPWMPDGLRTWMSTSTLGPRLSLWIQARVPAFLRAPMPRFPALLAGLTVAWSSLLLLLPLAFVPFANAVPALSLGLIGLGLASHRSHFGWMGMALSGGWTALLAAFGEALLPVALKLLSPAV